MFKLAIICLSLIGVSLGLKAENHNAVSKGSLRLNKGKTAISGTLEMTIINSATGTKYPASLSIYSEYHSRREFRIPPAYFDAATFNLLNQD